MASFLDDPNARQQALFQGLLMAGPALLAAASPSTQPGGLGRGFAAFGQNLGQGYRAGINDARTGAMANIQMQMLKEKMAEQERARKALESMYPQAQTPQTNFDTPPSAVAGQPSPIPSLMGGAPGITPQILQGLPAQEALKLMATSGLKQAETAEGRKWDLAKMGLQNQFAQQLKMAPEFVKPEKTGVSPELGDLSPGQKAIDTAFGKDLAEFVGAGGFADVQKSLAQLGAAKTSLGSGAALSGPVIGRTPDAIRALVNPESINVQEQIQEVAQRNLRLVLGAQFTEKEGERLIARVYNPALDEATNITRLDALTKQIATAAAAKQEAADYFDKHGTLKGFKGKLYTAADFNDFVNSLNKQGAKGNKPKTIRFDINGNMISP